MTISKLRLEVLTADLCIKQINPTLGNYARKVFLRGFQCTAEQTITYSV